MRIDDALYTILYIRYAYMRQLPFRLKKTILFAAAFFSIPLECWNLFTERFSYNIYNNIYFIIHFTKTWVFLSFTLDAY